jgi:hypothetical protein
MGRAVGGVGVIPLFGVESPVMLVSGECTGRLGTGGGPVGEMAIGYLSVALAFDFTWRTSCWVVVGLVVFGSDCVDEAGMGGAMSNNTAMGYLSVALALEKVECTLGWGSGCGVVDGILSDDCGGGE